MNYRYLAVGLIGISLLAAGCNKNADEKTNTNSNSAVSENMEKNSNSNTESGVEVGGALMVQSKDIVDNASNASNVTTLVTAVKAADLVATLKGAGPFTVFAPTNEAFNKLPAGTVDTLLKPENKAQLAKILTYHVVSGRYLAKDLTDGLVLESVEGETLTIGNKNGVITVNGTTMVQTKDVVSSNGVTFVIDSVLMPGTMMKK